MEKRFQLSQGNEACVGRRYRGRHAFYAGYPITPSTEIAGEARQTATGRR